MTPTPPTLTPEQADAYLQRIGIDGRPAVTQEWLERLHVAHLLHVPFENLDLHLGEPVRLETDALHDKLVVDRRGGYCYELNGLFAALLVTAGFDVSLVSSRTWMPGVGLSPPFDHLALIVALDGADWLVDVGFGFAFQAPHPLGSAWSEPGRRLRTVETDRGWQLESDMGEGWTPLFVLDPTRRHLSEFLPRSRWHETSPESPFRRGLLTSRATPDGRVTVTDDQVVVTDHGQRTEDRLPDGAARRRTLTTYFEHPVVDAFQAAMNGRPAPET